MTVEKHNSFPYYRVRGCNKNGYTRFAAVDILTILQCEA